MQRRPSLISALVCLLFFTSSAATSQQSEPSEEIRSMLRIASGLLPEIDKNQQPSMASNIASQQVRIGDLEGALATMQHVRDGRQRIWVAGNMAYALAWQGNLTLALALVQSSAKTDVQGKAQAYASIAEALAQKNDFQESLQIEKLIEDCSSFVGKPNLVVQTLIRIQSRQWAAGDETEAQTTLNAALEAVQSEKDRFTPEFADFIRAQMYGDIARELAREGNRPAAYAVLERVYDILADVVGASKQDVLYTLAATQANLGEFQLAMNTAAEMEPGQKHDSALFVIAMERTRQGDPQSAMDLALGFSEEFSRDTSLRVIADAQAASGNYVQALSTIGRIQGAGDRAYGLSELAFERAENQDPGAGLLTQIAWDAASSAGSETKPYVFAQIAVAKGMIGDFVSASEIISGMAEEDRFWAVQSLAQILVHAGKKTEAIAVAESQGSAYPKSCAYLGIASQLITEEREAVVRRDRSRL